jgi:hypothetical protein
VASGAASDDANAHTTEQNGAIGRAWDMGAQSGAASGARAHYRQQRGW